MASVSVTLVFFLLIVSPCLCSAISFSGLFTAIGKLFLKSKPKPSTMGNKVGDLPGLIPVGKTVPNGVDEGVKEFGIRLAKIYFGPDRAKGFRTGYRWAKRYFKVAKKCEENDTKVISCTQVITSPLKRYPGCVFQCIIDIGRTTTNGNTSDYCHWYMGCPPQEADCSLDDPEC